MIYILVPYLIIIVMLIYIIWKQNYVRKIPHITRKIRKQWLKTKMEKIKKIEAGMMSSEQIVDYAAETYAAFLAAERKGFLEEKLVLKGKLEAIENIARGKH